MFSVKQKFFLILGIISFLFFVYVLWLASAFMGGGADYYVDLPNGYLFRGGDGDGIITYDTTRKSIYGKVTEIAFNDDFIIAKQVPDSMAHEVEISTYLQRRNPQKSPDLKALADSILSADPYYKRIFSARENYWILNHHGKGILYGPFTKVEFERKKQELRVPASLVLKNAWDL